MKYPVLAYRQKEIEPENKSQEYSVLFTEGSVVFMSYITAQWENNLQVLV